jgi:hypothetical protein
MRGRGPDAQTLRRRGSRMAATCLTAALFAAPLPAAAAKMLPRPGPGPCREAVNGLVSMLDARTDDTALYRDTYGIVVNTCGPVRQAPWPPAAPPPSRDACHDLAAALVDLIEDDKMNTPAFAKARGAFALACAPR